jgi:hypothetical protein
MKKLACSNLFHAIIVSFHSSFGMLETSIKVGMQHAKVAGSYFVSMSAWTRKSALSHHENTV